jgi:hypothetical protein
MIERRSRISRRTEFLIGLGVALVGVAGILVAVATEAGGVFKGGLVIVALGVLAMLGIVLPRRKDGTRIWQSDQGKAI